MKKYKINYLVVLRNIAIIFLLISCNLALKQLDENELRMTQLNHSLISHRHKNVLKSSIYSYIDTDTEAIQSHSGDTQNKEFLGNFKITHYCACSKCCGPNAQGITASGAKVQEGVTIAVDRKVIPLGSKVYIDGYGERIAQDTGGAIKGNKIDIYVSDHNEALRLGVVYKDVWLIKEV